MNFGNYLHSWHKSMLWCYKIFMFSKSNNYISVLKGTGKHVNFIYEILILSHLAAFWQTRNFNEYHFYLSAFLMMESWSPTLGKRRVSLNPGIYYRRVVISWVMLCHTLKLFCMILCLLKIISNVLHFRIISPSVLRTYFEWNMTYL